MIYEPLKDSRNGDMFVNINGQLESRPVAGILANHNGYMNLRVPVLRFGEELTWVAGTRTPTVEQNRA